MAQVPQDERALVEAAARCSDEAFNALVERKRPLLRMVARRYADTPEDREDLMQEIIARLLEGRKRALRDWQPIAPFAAYLTTIASRLGIRFRERLQRLPWKSSPALPAAGDLWDEALAEAVPDPPHASPEHQLQAAEQARMVRQAAARLSPRDQAIVRLRFDEGLDSASLGSILGLSPASARKAVYDALRRLERLLDSEREALFPGV